MHFNLMQLRLQWLSKIDDGTTNWKNNDRDGDDGDDEDEDEDDVDDDEQQQ